MNRFHAIVTADAVLLLSIEFMGLMQFIGELFIKQMLGVRVMHAVIHRLLTEIENPVEEELEALCVLVSTIGKFVRKSSATITITIPLQ